MRTLLFRRTARTERIGDVVARRARETSRENPCETFIAEDANTALAEHHRAPFDVVVVGADGGDAASFVQAFRAAPGARRAVVLVAVDPAQKVDAAQLLAAGATDVVTDEDPDAIAVRLQVAEARAASGLFQSSLLLADRMACLGTLAAGMAHEINNPLSYVLTNVEFSAAKVSRVCERLHDAAAVDVLSECARALSEARSGAERVRDVVRQLKTFSRGDEDSHGPVDVREIVRAVVRMAQNEVRYRARLRLDLQDVPAVDAGEAPLGQVILNLLVNAAQALPEGHPEDHEIVISTAFDPSGRVRIDVCDTGSGIPPEAIGRVFDPFFTTKPMGSGTGLGLSICHGIVSAKGGEITVESEVGRGTTFRVFLPASARTAATFETLPPPSSGRRARVLCIDDEPLLLKALERMFDAEHDILTLTNAREALSRIQKGDRFDVILCDLMMPDMTGMDFHDELSTCCPEQLAHLVFLTGGAFTARAQNFLARVPNRRLEKPFDFEAVASLLRDG